MKDGASMIWPEFVDASGRMLSEGEVPASGLADMYVISPERRAFHAPRICAGTKGYFVEGATRVAECEVVSVSGLHTNRRE